MIAGNASASVIRIARVPQDIVWIFVGLLTSAIPLIWIARRLHISYPIVLVIGGLVLGFVPGLPRVQLDPNLVLLIFLPPLLYWEAITAPTDVMRANAGQIWTLAIGLVLATTATVAFVAHAAIAHIAWPMAFVLGAIVAPTDELASAPVLERLRMPRHLIAIVEGESFLNDAISLILYSTAVTAAVTGAFDPGQATVQLFVAAFGGLALGLATGRLAVEGWRRITDEQLQAVISFNLPYLAYVLAQRFNLSGVLAVVYAGVLANRYTPVVITPAARSLATGFWETAVFLANALLFLLVGLQLHDLARMVHADYSWHMLLWYAFLVNVTIIGTRFIWFMVQEYLPPVGRNLEHPEPDWKHALIASWSGLRGAVSLAAALAIPATIAGGAPLPQRNLVIFLTFSVILVTLVGGGLTLPLLIRRLNLPPGTEEDEDLQRGILRMSEAALARIEELEREGELGADDAARLRRRYEHNRKHSGGHPKGERAVFDAEQQVLDAERAALIELRARGEIDNTALRRLQRVLDISEERLGKLGKR